LQSTIDFIVSELNYHQKISLIFNELYFSISGVQSGTIRNPYFAIAANFIRDSSFWTQRKSRKTSFVCQLIGISKKSEFAEFDN
jgi:hypothetical protein